jgi:4-amino-4-deoxy-L-arabinose transferase-like glycosyltransferase
MRPSAPWVLAVALVLLATAALRHQDDTDSDLYTVVARNMVTDGTWFDLRYTENVHPHFREHLPFGFWPSAFVVRTVGEWALPWLGVWWAALTVALVTQLGSRLGGATAGACAGLILATTEQFVVTSAGARLDGPLVFWSLASAAPLLLTHTPTWKTWGLSGLCAALAALIKGPFGLVLLVAVCCAQACSSREVRWLKCGALTTTLAALPVIAFLLLERARGNDWWSGYVQAQLLASATGSRTDGNPSPLFPLLSIAARFWPWLPVAMWGAVKARPRVLVVWLLITVLALCLPSRKLWHHVLIAFPALSLTAGLALAPWVERFRNASLPAAAAIVVAAVGVVALEPRGRAVSCSAFQATLRELPTGSRVLVGTSTGEAHWREVAVLATEFKLRPWLIDRPELASMFDGQLALVPSGWVLGPEWSVIQAAKEWALLRREVKVTDL